MSPVKVKKLRAKVKVSTILLILAFLIVGVFALVVYSDPHILDPVNEVLWGQRPLVEPSKEEILRWTTAPSFNAEIDNSIKMRFIPVPPLEVPITEMGKANPFVPVSP
ncbi:MAG: hypothetical protein NUV68_00665 [Caldiserica bacterium]|nr:hypothetical protein [Caldisericota bacterium]MDH7561871.1 hypothetical protein [Caldisericota bacterium]